MQHLTAQGDGAWEPKDSGCKSPGQKSSGLKAGSDGDSEDGDLADIGEPPGLETPAVKRATSASASRELKPPAASGGKPVKTEVAASSKGPAAGKPGSAAMGAARGGSGGDGAAVVSSKAPAAGKAAQADGNERTRAGLKPKVRSLALHVFSSTTLLSSMCDTSWRGQAPGD